MEAYEWKNFYNSKQQFLWQYNERHWRVKSSYRLFQNFFTDEMLKHIAHRTNLCSVQQNITKGTIAAQKDEIERYISMLLKISKIQALY